MSPIDPFHLICAGGAEVADAGAKGLKTSVDECVAPGPRSAPGRDIIPRQILYFKENQIWRLPVKPTNPRDPGV